MANQGRKDLANRQNQQRSQQLEIQQTVYQGPLPAPQDLFAYDQLLPGTAGRIVAMAEREQAHRMNIEDMRARADIKHRDDVAAGQRAAAKGVFTSDLFGQAAGAVVGLSCIAGAIYLALQPGVHPTIPIALVGLPVASIIQAIRTKDKKPKEK